MRASEFVSESVQVKTHGTPSVLPSDMDATLPGVFVQKQLRNTDPYMQYRYGVAVATSRAIAAGELPADSFSQETGFAENLTQVMFSPQDLETIKLASKLMGTEPTQIADTKSREPHTVNITSPVASRKRNRWGI
jgi:hypothetical protein